MAASAVGTTIEWYDFFLYDTAASLVFPKFFFPGVSPFAGDRRNPGDRDTTDADTISSGATPRTSAAC